MSICSLNFIPILITVLFCGFLFVYFNTRLGEVKNTLEKQNRVLTSFITGVQNDIRGSSGMCGMCSNGICSMGMCGGITISSDYLASEEAIRAVQKLEREKIVVSDDEDDESDSEDSDSESDEEDSDSEEEGECEENIKVIKLNKHSENMPPMEFELLSEVHLAAPVVDLVEAVEVAVAHSVEVAPAVVVDEPLNLLNLIPMDDESLHSDVNSTSAYEHMKVDDLRKVVSDKSLASKEEVKKLKKPELVALLKK